MHPENTRIVVLFSIAFVSFFVGVIQLLNFAKGTIVGFAQTLPKAETTQIFAVPKGANTALFSQQVFQNVAEVPTHNQTLVQLSQAINSNANVKDLMGNAFSDDKIQWSATPHSSNLVASVQDPTLLYLGLVCLAVFIIFLCVAIWRLWENKIPKL